MIEDIGDILVAINEVGDSIWLGDFETAKHVADLNLAELSNRFKLEKLETVALNLRRYIREWRKNAKEKNIEDIEGFVTDQLFEKMQAEEIAPENNIRGVLVIRLSNLRDTLDYILKSKEQKTLDSFKEKDTEQEEIFKNKGRYRYLIRKLPTRWDVRVVLTKSVLQWNLEGLKNNLREKDFTISDSQRNESSVTFTVFSNNLFAEILAQDKQIELSIRAIEEENNMNKIEKFVVNVVDLLSGQDTFTDKGKA